MFSRIVKMARAVRKVAETIEDLLDDGDMPDPLEEAPYTILKPEEVAAIRNRLAAVPPKNFRIVGPKDPDADALVEFLSSAELDVSRLIYANRRQEERMRQVMRILSTADTKANLTAWPVSILRDAVEDAITFIDPMAKQN